MGQSTPLCILSIIQDTQMASDEQTLASGWLYSKRKTSNPFNTEESDTYTADPKNDATNGRKWFN